MEMMKYKDFLMLENGFSEEKATYYQTWVYRFLLLKDDFNISHEERISLFLEGLDVDSNISDEECQDAEDAVRIFLEKFHPAEETDQNVFSMDFVAAKMMAYMKLKNYSESTKKIYIDWCYRYYDYGLEHNCDFSCGECIINFIDDWEKTHPTAPSTKNQILNALLFMYCNVFNMDLESIRKKVRAKTDQKLPVFLEPMELKSIFDQLKGIESLLVEFLFGTGLRLVEMLELRVRDIDYDNNLVFVRKGPEEARRSVILPQKIRKQLLEQIESVKALQEQDLAIGHGKVPPPDEFDDGTEFNADALEWQYLFPRKKLQVDQDSGGVFRDHIPERVVQQIIKKAVSAAGLNKTVTAQTLRHSFAVHLLCEGLSLRKLQKLLGHKNLVTTSVYKKVMESQPKEPRSPLDFLL